MVRLPQLTGKEIITILTKQGFIVRRQKGSHVTLYKLKDGKGLYVTVPVHAGKEMLPSTLLSIIRQAGMDKDEFVSLA